jgi:hypothetical protein
MQKFTRSLTREIEVAGERLAVTFSEEGLAVRPVGSRRPPRTMSWAAWACAAAGRPAPAGEPTPSELAEAVKILKAGGEKPAGGKESGHEAGHQATPAAARPPAHAPAGGAAPPGQHAGHSGGHAGAGAGHAPPHASHAAHAPHAPSSE